MSLLWLIPILPAAGAAVNGLFGIRWFSRTVAGVLACAAMGGALALSVYALASLLVLAPDARVIEVVLGNWIPPIPLATADGIGTFKVAWSLTLDPLSSLMLLVVTGVGFVIHVYSTAYMRDEPPGAYARFFCYLNLFCFFMLLLVLASNFLVLFVGWEGVGLCSYLLIGFWYEKTSAADAGKKAFLVNRIGDWAFLLGIFLVFFTFGTLDFREVAAAAARTAPEAAAFGVISTICILLFIGATGKSAQIPLFVWLPDAMEGPTPVSALIHAATMVTAGVYMIARNSVLFAHAPLVLEMVAVVGALTAVMAACIGLVQSDIKRVLAYSTISQIGYMFLATGVGAFGAAMFHLLTHAFSKALLFLGSGSVIHAVAGEQDMQRMGGLKKVMPVTFASMVLGALGIVGIPPLSGFFSKDEILAGAYSSHRTLYAIAMATGLLTALYMFRLISLTFYGAYRGATPSTDASPAAAAEAANHGVQHPADALAHGQAQRDDHEVTHGPADVPGDGGAGTKGPGAPHRRHHAGWTGPHESPRMMTIPLMVLAVGAVFAGFLGVPPALGGADALGHFLEPSFAIAAQGTPAEPGVESGRGPAGLASLQAAAAERPVSHSSRTAALAVMLASVLVALAGIAAARYLYQTRPDLPGRLADRWPAAHALLLRKFWVDEIYGATIVGGTLGAARGLDTIDHRVVDGAVDASGSLTRIGAWFAHMFDKHVVDGVVNGLARGAGRGSFSIRRVQSGLVQNYAVLMVFGLFAFLTVYLLVR